MRLLEHGMLEQTQRIDEIQFDGKSPGNKKDDEEEDDEDEETASMEEFEKKISTYVEGCLRGASGSGSKHKDNMVYQARKDLIASFNKIALAKKCSSCSGCVSPLPLPCSLSDLTD